MPAGGSFFSGRTDSQFREEDPGPVHRKGSRRFSSFEAGASAPCVGLLSAVLCADAIFTEYLTQNLSNIFKDGENYTITDYDKTAKVIPVNYLIASAMFILAVDSGFRFNDENFLKSLGLTEKEIKIYQAMYARLI